MSVIHVSPFETRQQMERSDFEIFYRSDDQLYSVPAHNHAFFELNCALVAAEYAVGSKLALRGRIDRIADVTPDFLCACG